MIAKIKRSLFQHAILYIILNIPGTSIGIVLVCELIRRHISRSHREQLVSVPSDKVLFSII